MMRSQAFYVISLTAASCRLKGVTEHYVTNLTSVNTQKCIFRNEIRQCI